MSKQNNRYSNPYPLFNLQRIITTTEMIFECGLLLLTKADNIRNRSMSRSTVAYKSSLEIHLQGWFC